MAAQTAPAVYRSASGLTVEVRPDEYRPGLWVATSPDVDGLLVVGDDLESMLDSDIPEAIAELRAGSQR